eukprot:g47752.t1
MTIEPGAAKSLLKMTCGPCTHPGCNGRLFPAHSHLPFYPELICQETHNLKRGHPIYVCDTCSRQTPRPPGDIILP